jgi:hypothetical protein
MVSQRRTMQCEVGDEREEGGGRDKAETRGVAFLLGSSPVLPRGLR